MAKYGKKATKKKSGSKKGKAPGDSSPGARPPFGKKKQAM